MTVTQLFVNTGASDDRNGNALREVSVAQLTITCPAKYFTHGGNYRGAMPALIPTVRLELAQSWREGDIACSSTALASPVSTSGRGFTTYQTTKRVIAYWGKKTSVVDQDGGRS